MGRRSLSAYLRLLVAVALAALAVWPARALAAAPTATTSPSVSFAQSGAVLNGYGTTGGLESDYYFQYALSNDPFCTSGATEGASSSTPTQHWSNALMSPFGESVTVGGLSGGATYCFRFVAVNADGTGYGALATFAFPVVVPMASVRVITTGPTTATADAWVSPEGQPTRAEIDYDLAGSPFCTSKGQQPAAYTIAPISLAGSPQELTLPLSGLVVRDEYCIAVVAHNPSGATTSFGPMFTAGVALVQPGMTTPIGATAASVTGAVDPVGQATTYDLAYDTVSSIWCRTGGASGAPSLVSPLVLLPFTDATYHPVTVTVHGLSPTIGYCLALIAHNPSGASPIEAPSSLPAMLTLTVYAIDLLSLPDPSGGLVSSTPRWHLVLAPVLRRAPKGGSGDDARRAPPRIRLRRVGSLYR